ncbi:type II secretion system minor pseudopilin GspJ [Sphingomonas sp. CFBP 13733]|nr:type II secretion system minor pseudopilin GspJ [Sphingomonas sp. CFBP 13733]MBD8639246.1 type II secretion system minor pseudopilin GspJ [Sphingomonas sp. CFBP 13733]
MTARRAVRLGVAGRVAHDGVGGGVISLAVIPANAGTQGRGRGAAGLWVPGRARDDGVGRRSAEHGFTPVRRSAEHGFTLVEVMVSLLIFGMIAAAGVAILSFSVKAQSATGTKLDDLGALTRTMSILSADLGQAALRGTRDESGAPVPAFVGESGSDVAPMLRLVRGGWTNIDGAARSSTQKVAYRVADGALQRIAYPMVDGAPPLPPAVLLPNVRQVRLRYRLGGAWSDRWDGVQGVPLPEAMELSVQRTDGLVYRQLFLVGSGYAPPAREVQNEAP